MTRVLEFPRASSRNGIQTLRVIHVQEINSNDSRISRADLNIIEVQGKNPREWISPERPSIDYLSDWTRSFTPSKRRQRRPFRLDRKLFHRFHSGERSSFSRIPSGKLPRIISNPSVSAEETRKNVTRSSSEREEESRRVGEESDTNLLNLIELSILRCDRMFRFETDLRGKTKLFLHGEKKRFSLIN